MLTGRFWIAAAGYLAFATSVVMTFAMTAACGVDSASGGARTPSQTPIAQSPPEYVFFEDMRYRLVSSVTAGRDEMEEAGTVMLEGGNEVGVYRTGEGDRAIYTTESPSSGAVSAGRWYRWLPSPETPVPYDLRRST